MAHWYSLSTDLNPNWSSYLPPQSELLSYWHHLAHKYALRPHISLNTRLEVAEWDDATQLYRLTLKDVKTGNVWYEQAEVVVCATGSLSTPTVKSLKGVESFEGPSWHSAEWRHDVELNGRRVGVIGNGCSA
jgi:cation diffusion facilitator CzcD-associated flavoprotein CzcO